MPTITVRSGASFEVDANKRLVLALRDNDVDILHRCGGYANCTTCRVKIHKGEPEEMTRAERNKLTEDKTLGEFRLSCQILCDHDMTVEPLMSLESTRLDGRGSRPQDNITPSAVWVDKP
jgi:ferredoxin